MALRPQGVSTRLGAFAWAGRCVVRSVCTGEENRHRRRPGREGLTSNRVPDGGFPDEYRIPAGNVAADVAFRAGEDDNPPGGRI